MSVEYVLGKRLPFVLLINPIGYDFPDPSFSFFSAQVRRLGGGSEIPERPPSPQIIEAQKYVRARIERRWFLMFKDTQSYQKKLIDSNVTEMVEDIIMKRRLQRSEAAWKVIIRFFYLQNSRDFSLGENFRY